MSGQDDDQPDEPPGAIEALERWGDPSSGPRSWNELADLDPQAESPAPPEVAKRARPGSQGPRSIMDFERHFSAEHDAQQSTFGPAGALPPRPGQTDLRSAAPDAWLDAMRDDVTASRRASTAPPAAGSPRRRDPSVPPGLMSDRDRPRAIPPSDGSYAGALITSPPAPTPLAPRPLHEASADVATVSIAVDSDAPSADSAPELDYGLSSDSPPPLLPDVGLAAPQTPGPLLSSPAFPALQPEVSLEDPSGDEVAAAGWPPDPLREPSALIEAPAATGRVDELDPFSMPIGGAWEDHDLVPFAPVEPHELPAASDPFEDADPAVTPDDASLDLDESAPEPLSLAPIEDAPTETSAVGVALSSIPGRDPGLSMDSGVGELPELDSQTPSEVPIPDSEADSEADSAADSGVLSLDAEVPSSPSWGDDPQSISPSLAVARQSLKVDRPTASPDDEEHIQSSVGPLQLDLRLGARPEQPELARRYDLAELILEELEAEDERGRRALLLHAFGRLAEGLELRGEALKAYSAARAQDADFSLNNWALHRIVALEGHTESLVDLLATRHERLHRAGHLAAALGDDKRARSLWAQAGGGSASALAAALARYFGALQAGDDVDALAAANVALESVSDDTLWKVLALDAVRLADRLERPVQMVRPLLEELVERVGLDAPTAATLEGGGGPARRAVELAAMQIAPHGQGAARTAYVLGRLNRPTEALRVCQEAIAQGDPTPFLIDWASRLARTVENSGAWRELSGHAKGLSDRDVAARFFQIGLMAESVGDEAVQDRGLSTAIDAMPEFAPARAAQGRVDHAHGRWARLVEGFEDEIQVLERSLAQDELGDQRQRLIDTLLARYDRAARLASGPLEDRKLAEHYWRRGLALGPTDGSTFAQLEEQLDASGDDEAVLALWIERAGRLPEGVEKLQALTYAAVLNAELGRYVAAAPLFREALRCGAAAPDAADSAGHLTPYALRLAGRAFGESGAWADRAAVHGVLAETLVDDPEAWLRAAELLQLVPEQRALALTAFITADTLHPGQVRAVDGLARCADAPTLRAVVGRLPADARQVRDVVVPLAEALVGVGEPALAGSLLEGWIESASKTDRASSVALQRHAAELATDWSATARLLEVEASYCAGYPAAAFLARAGEVRETRLGDREGAGALFRQAIACHESNVAAFEGLARLEAHRRAEWWPGRFEDPSGALVARARDAEAEGRFETRKALLLQAADCALDPASAEAIRAVVKADDWDAALAAGPTRRDLFLACTEQLDLAGWGGEALALHQARVEFEDEIGRPGRLLDVARRALKAGDSAAALDACDRLLVHEPTSVPALAIRRALGAEGAEQALASALQGVGAQRLTRRTRTLAAIESGAADAAEWVAQVIEESPDGDRPLLDALTDALASDAERRVAALETVADRLGVRCPDGVEARWRAGAAYAEALGQPAAAITSWAPVFDQLSPERRLTLGQLANAEGHEQAELWLREVAEGPLPEADAARLALAEISANLGRWEQAARFMSAWTGVVEPARGLELRGACLGQVGDWAGAVEALAGCAQLPGSEAERAARAEAVSGVARHVGDRSELACAWLARAVRLEPTDLERATRLATLCVSEGFVAEAGEALGMAWRAGLSRLEPGALLDQLVGLAPVLDALETPTLDARYREVLDLLEGRSRSADAVFAESMTPLGDRERAILLFDDGLANVDATGAGARDAAVPVTALRWITVVERVATILGAGYVAVDGAPVEGPVADADGLLLPTSWLDDDATISAPIWAGVARGIWLYHAGPDAVRSADRAGLLLGGSFAAAAAAARIGPDDPRMVDLVRFTLSDSLLALRETLEPRRGD